MIKVIFGLKSESSHVNKLYIYTMQNAFTSLIESELSALKEAKLVIAISGGVDSVVLAHLCFKNNLNFALAHCNFNLRGEESDADEEFVLELGDRLNAEVFVQNFDTVDYAKSQKVSIQMAARELRYDWFQELALAMSFDYILTAHQADDNLETFLINFTRGTGLNGLTGIPLVNDNIIRPLLGFSRIEIENYAKGEAINWREDSSNSSRKYLRNKLRHEVIPILKEINPSLLESFQNTVSNLRDTADIVDESLNAVAKRAITRIDEGGVYYKVSEFLKVNNPKAYLHEMFKEYGFTEWNDVEELLEAQSGKFVKSGTHRLIKHREYLILTDLEPTETEVLVWEEGLKVIKTPLGTVAIEDSDTLGDYNDRTIFIDKDKVSFPMSLRLWRPGDSFCPFGMTGRKKLSKFLKDEKYSLVDKENTWLLLSGSDVVWVVGKRADNRFRVDESTKKILKMTLE